MLWKSEDILTNPRIFPLGALCIVIDKVGLSVSALAFLPTSWQRDCLDNVGTTWIIPCGRLVIMTLNFDTKVKTWTLYIDINMIFTWCSKLDLSVFFPMSIQGAWGHLSYLVLAAAYDANYAGNSQSHVAWLVPCRRATRKSWRDCCEETYWALFAMNAFDVDVVVVVGTVPHWRTLVLCGGSEIGKALVWHSLASGIVVVGQSSLTACGMSLLGCWLNHWRLGVGWLASALVRYRLARSWCAGGWWREYSHSSLVCS